MKKPLIFIGLVLVAMFQIGILSHIKMQAGKIDLVLLVSVTLALVKLNKLDDVILIGLTSGFLMGFVSAEPMLFTAAFYLAAVLLAYFIRVRGFKVTLFAVFISVGLITVLHQAFFGAYLIFDGAAFTVNELFQFAILPSLLLNILAVIPVYCLTLEIWRLFGPLGEEE